MWLNYIMNYKFYQSTNLVKIIPINKSFKNVDNPYKLYDYLLNIWSIETCAPRLRKKWKNTNPTLGQCSITAFLVQDIFGGDVFGVLLEDGNFHCFNVINDCLFDLTSEQFENAKLNYSLSYPQNRDIHFSKIEKFKRYLLLKNELINQIK